MLRTTPPVAAGAIPYFPVLGTNTGFVSVFDSKGNFVARAVTGGNLNAPWGIAIAPAGFGIYGGDLLIGNFGDGLITAYNPTTFAYLGVVADGVGKPIAYPGLWSIFGDASVDPTALYFTAGLAQETHGLYGVINNAATTTGAQTFNLSASASAGTVTAGGATSFTFSVAPTNGFSGMVNLSCSGLPASATCSFTPQQIAVSATAPATGTLTIQTSSGNNGAMPAGIGGGALGAIAALLAGTMAANRRRRWLKWTPALGMLMLTIGLASGCGTSPMSTTPQGTSTVTVMATSGSTQTMQIALTVN